MSNPPSRIDVEREYAAFESDNPAGTAMFLWVLAAPDPAQQMARALALKEWTTKFRTCPI